MSLDLRDITILQAATPLFAPLTASVAAGEVLTVMGPSGSGKSSLLAYLAGALPPGLSGRGTVTLAGRTLNDLPVERRDLGLLFQDDLLFPHLSVGENLAFGLPHGPGRPERAARVDAALAEAGLPGMADRDPATLSGGQRARVSLMRTLLAEPAALLLDEPFSQLDQALRAEIRAFVFGHAQARRLPVLLVSHDPADAPGRIVRLDGA